MPEYTIDRVEDKLILMKDRWTPIGGAVVDFNRSESNRWRAEIGCGTEAQVIGWYATADEAAAALLDRAEVLEL